MRNEQKYSAPLLKQHIKERVLRTCIHSRLEYGLSLVLVRFLAKNYNHPVTSAPPVEACSILCPCFSPHFSHPFVYNWLHSSRQRFLFSPFHSTFHRHIVAMIITSGHHCYALIPPRRSGAGEV